MSKPAEAPKTERNKPESSPDGDEEDTGRPMEPLFQKEELPEEHQF